MIILDTNVISEAAEPAIDQPVRDWFAMQSNDTLYTTAISLGEISFGIEKLPEGRRKTSLRARMELIFANYFENRILPFDEHAARAYGLIIASARARGRSILMADGQIAAIAHVHGFAVATRDTAPFEAAGVAVINPWLL